MIEQNQTVSEQFRRACGCDGDWAKLFRRSSAYRGVLLLQDNVDERSFVVIDRWTEGDSFTCFHREFAEDYDALDQQCLELTEEEILVGNFTEMPA